MASWRRRCYRPGNSPEGSSDGYLFLSLSGYCTCKLVRFYPDTLRLENDDMKINWESVSGAPTGRRQKRELEIDLVTDFIVRINSPRIARSAGRGFHRPEQEAESATENCRCINS